MCSAPAEGGLSLDIPFVSPTIPRRRMRGDQDDHLLPLQDLPKGDLFLPTHDNFTFSNGSDDKQLTYLQYKQPEDFYAIKSLSTSSEDSLDITDSSNGYTISSIVNDTSIRAAMIPKKLHYLETECEIDFNQLVFIAKLGEGAFGEVWRAHLWDIEVAVKVLKGNFLRASPLEELADEVAMLKSLRHPNCVLFLGFTTPPHFCIVTEYLSLGSLRSILENPMVQISNRIIIKIALSVAKGMNYLHTQSPVILHRDLNSHNILCSQSWNIKVADYGLSRTTDSSMDFCGAIPWRAPEVKSGIFLQASDVYSYGIVLWELVTRKLPWEGVDMVTVVSEVRKGKRPEIPSNCLPLIQNLIERCWAAEPRYRPTFHEIIEILKPYETKRDSEVTMCYPSSPDIKIPIGNSCDLMNFSGAGSIARCWETFFNTSVMDSGMDYVLQQSRLMKGFITGSLCLSDPFGRMVWIIGLESCNTLEREEKHIQEHRHALQQFSLNLCAPITRQTMRLNLIRLRSGATHASTAYFTIQEGLGNESMKIYEDNSLSIHKGLTKFWCGTLILTDSDSTLVLVITLFNSQEALDMLSEEGFHERQIKAFQNLLADVPQFLDYNIKLNSFAPARPITTSVSLQSLPKEISSSRKNALELTEEPVLNSFFCITHFECEIYVGHLYICAEHIRIKCKAKLLGKERVISMHYKEILSIDENRPHSRRGHTLIIMTTEIVLTVTSLLQREKVLRLIFQQAAKLKPSVTILRLVNGEPNV